MTSWLEERRWGIGASDIGAILGVSSYMTPLDVYLDKIGEGVEQESEAIDFGHRFEKFVIEEFSARTGKAVIANPKMVWLNDEWIRCTPDAVVLHERALVEAKTWNIFKRDEWAEGPPLYIEAQCQWQMAASPEMERVYVPVYFAGREFEIFVIERDEELIAELIEVGRVFWFDHVLPRIPPGVTSRDSDTLNRWLAQSEETGKELEKDRLRQIMRCVELGPIIKSYEDELEYLKNQLKVALGQDEIGLIDGEKVVSWKPQSRTGIDAKALKEELPDVYEKFTTKTSFRVMRFHWKKEEE